MKLKHLFFSLAMLCAMTASAAKAIEEVRIYINPGHGAWCGECRHMGTVTHGGPTYTDTAGFFESNTNLQKGLGMFYKLKEYGMKHNGVNNARDLTQNIVMSRIKSGDVHNGLYDRPLSEIAAEAELNNFDMFISIHSNAHSDGSTVNYPLFLYRGYDNSESVPGSKAMAAACWPHWIKNPHMMWSSYTTSTNIRGDVSFWNEIYYTTHSNGKTYGGYYGVLRQGVPGFLVEGYFHTYQPARHKAMNWDACKWEGEAYAKGVNDYFGFGKKDSYGAIYGVLRDAETPFSHTYYTPNTSTLDYYLPINNATVTLKNSNDEVVQTYKTDDEYNGVFVFNKVTPGTYKIVYSHPDYKDLTETITVTANETVFPTPQISTSTEQIPVKGVYAYGLTSSQDGDICTLKFKATDAVEKGLVIFTNTSTGATQSITINNIVKGENSVTVDAKSLGEDATFSWAVAIENPKSTGVELIHSDNTIIYNNGTKDARIGVAIDKDATSAHFGTIYTMTAMGQGLQKFNPDYSKNGSKVITGLFGKDTDASTSSNKYVRSNRLEIYKGKVYIANYANYSTGIWEYDPATGATPTNISGITYYERAVAFIGEGSSRKAFSLHENNVQRFDIGTATSWTSGSPTKSNTTAALLDNGDGDIIVTDNAVIASQTRYSGNNASSNPAFAVFDHDLTVVYKSDVINSSLNGSENGGMALSDDKSIFAIANSYNSSGNAGIRIQVYDVTWSGSTPAFIHKYSIPLDGTYCVDQMEFDYAGNLVIASQQKGLLVYAIKNPARQTVTKATSTIQGVREPGVQGHYAYDLKMAQGERDYTLTFKSTGDVASASVILTPITAGAEVVMIAIDGVKAGENTFVVDATTLGVGVKYNWAVALDNPSSPSVELMHSDNSIIYNNGTNDARIGLAIDKDVTSAHFGTIYTMTAMGQGLQKFNPDYSKNGSKVITGMFGADTDASTSTNKYVRSNRIHVNNGKVYIANYANQNSGVWVYNPSGTNATQVLSGFYERAVSFHGEGADRVMYVVHESNFRYYNIGANDSWSGDPTGTYTTNMINGDGDVLATSKGTFVSQNRFTGNNTSDVPVFQFVGKSSGTVTFTSDALSSTLTGSQSGGMAISDDLSTFAIVDAQSSVNVQIYSVTWNGETPSFTHQYSIPLSGTVQVDQMAFDYAGNLVIASQQKGLLVYALKADARTTTTPASTSLVIEGVAKPLYIVGAGEALGEWDPVNAAEFTFADGVYIVEVEETTEFKISTIKGVGETDEKWNVFNAGNLAVDAAITNGGTVNLSVNKDAGNIILPWAGVWTITVAADLSTLTATTETPEPAPSYPEVIYAIGNVGGYNWSTSNGIELAHQGEGVYSGEVTVDDTGDGNGYFQFATTLGENWEAVNAGTRYGALTKDEAIVLNEVTSMTNDWGGSTQSWMIKSDTYIMVVDIVNCTVTVSPKTVGVEGIKADDNTPAVYYNLQGIEVANPENGVFIKKQGNIVTKEYVK
ncbi:MAG: carboxypeptidase regulatory-like domain-containing protein [Muribaculaceae bacterium]|nr:carboxypeptidase regulatory-like domain-containing protein [Muribaculaceae bacterium]